MKNDELNEIIKELQSAPEVFRLAIKFYNSMPSGKNKKELGRCISEAKENFRMLDVILEDIQWDLVGSFSKVFTRTSLSPSTFNQSDRCI